MWRKTFEEWRSSDVANRYINDDVWTLLKKGSSGLKQWKHLMWQT